LLQQSKTEEYLSLNSCTRHNTYFGILDYKFEAPQEPPPPAVDDEVRRREEEELQRVLAMSVQDKGGRALWDAYSAVPSNVAGGSSSASDLGRKSSISAAPSSSRVQSSYTAPTYHAGYAPARTPSPKAQSPKLSSAGPTSAGSAPPPATALTSAPVASHSTPADVSAPITSEPIQGQIPVVTRVRALHTFEPTEAGELAFDKGDVIKVVDRGYKDWWRGQLKGRTGIFPVNYVVSSDCAA
jgi:signal transducing adaptor molecule